MLYALKRTDIYLPDSPIFGSFSFAAEPDGFFSLPKHEHPGILAVHDTLAVYKGTETMPENIWPRVSVPFAVFTITDYLNYEIRCKYGQTGKT